MLKVGLTGGIGSGKSTAAKYFAKFNIPIVDADKIAHKLLLPNTIPYKKIVSHFGNSFLTPPKTIDRKKIRELIFQNKKERLWLEKLLHPHICAEMIKSMALLKAPYCIVVIPLLFESKFSPKVDRILVINCTKKTQIRRIRERNNYTIAQIKKIIASQINNNECLKLADDIIHNTGTLISLKEAIKKMHKFYLSF